jgi:hypothetical protein
MVSRAGTLPGSRHDRSWRRPHFDRIEIRGRNRQPMRGAAELGGGESERMRKHFALFLVALVALTMVVAAYGCGGSKPAENTGAEGTSSETAAPADTGMGAMHDSSSMMADTTKK